MRSLWYTSLALSLGLLTTGVRAGDETWRPAGQPVAVAESGPAVTLGAPVSLGRPVPIQDGASTVDPQFRPIAYTTSDGAVYRGAAPSDPIISRPMPIGPGDGQTVSSWSRAPEAAPVIEQGPAPTPITNPAPVVADPLGAGMTANGICNPCPPCGDPCCCVPCCGGCCPDFGQRWYVSGEYLMWWLKASPTPVLVTTGDPNDGNFAGALDRPGTVPLFGGDHIATDLFSGARLKFGYWFTDDHSIGLDFNGFFVGSRTDNFNANSRGDMVLARPFNDTIEENAEQIANLNVGLAGSVTVAQRTSLWGAEANLRSNLWCGCCMSVDVLAGYRTLGLDESLGIDEHLVVLGNTPTTASMAGSRIDVNDTFKTNNLFNGGQVGCITEFRKGRWFVDLSTKVAIGGMEEQVNINGFTTLSPVINGVSGTPSTGPGGLLTGATTNIGRYTRDVFAVVPEVGLNIGYQCTDHIRVFAGYNFLYCSNVARPGLEIDTTSNPLRVFGSTSTEGPARPAFVFKDTDFWAQGISFGLEFRY